MPSKSSSPSFLDIFVLFVMTIILFAYIRDYYGEVEYVTSSVDGKSYLVRKLPDRQEAADILARMNENLMKLVRHMRAKYPDNKDVQRMYKNYKPDNLSEGGMEVGYTSYSVNKGEKLVMCVRQKDGSFVKMNVLMYVAIHEMAHLMTKDVGHTPTYWNNFRFLLKESIKISVYSKVDYAEKPHDYCGIKITSSVI